MLDKEFHLERIVNMMVKEYSRLNFNHDKQMVSVRFLYFLPAQNILSHNDCKWKIKGKNYCIYFGEE